MAQYYIHLQLKQNQELLYCYTLLEEQLYLILLQVHSLYHFRFLVTWAMFGMGSICRVAFNYNHIVVGYYPKFCVNILPVCFESILSNSFQFGVKRIINSLLVNETRLNSICMHTYLFLFMPNAHHTYTNLFY